MFVTVRNMTKHAHLFPQRSPERQLDLKLTNAAVDKIKKTEKRQEIPDSLVVGLYLVVQPTGRKSWQVRYRTTAVQRRMTLGSYPLIGLKEARLRARDALLDAHDGGDPAAVKGQRNKDKDLNVRVNVSALVEQFYSRHLSNLKSGKDALRFLERFATPVWGDRDIRSISRRDVIDLLDDIVDSGRAITANRVLAHLRKFMNWCVEREILDRAPTDKIKAPAKENVIERVLSDQEVRWLWLACDRVGEPWGAMVKMLILTGQRRGEVVGMTDAEIENGIWHLRATRTKNGRSHVVPLSEPARTVLARKVRIYSEAGYVFCTNGTNPVSGFAKAQKRLRSALLEISAEETGKDVQVPSWTFHDLRRTAATGMARLGIAVRVTEAVLNHVSGTGSGIVAVYQRHDFAEEKRQALEAWGQYVKGLVEEGGGKELQPLEARR